MTEAATEAPAPAAIETPPAAVPTGSEAGTKPAWLAEDKFWDGEAKAPRSEDIYKSYRELQGAFGKRIHDLSPEARKALVSAVPEDMRTAWATEERARLAEDAEFLTPLQEKWRAENAPVAAPEKYEPPADLPIDMEHPAVAGLMEVAKEYGLPQEAFAKLAKMGLDVVAPYEADPTPEYLTEVLGTDFAPRILAVGNRVRTVLGTDAGNTLLRTLKSPDQFQALEKLVKMTGEMPLDVGNGSSQTSQWTPERLRNAVFDPRYIKRDPAFIAEVTAAFKKQYPGDVI